METGNGETTVGREFLTRSLEEFGRYKSLADRALAQVGDEPFFDALGAESNSLAVIVKHVAGNLRSRWTDFLTTDGEKPDRDRDAEFEVASSEARASLTAAWEEGWDRLFATLRALREEDLLRTVRIRGEPHTVIQAVQRSLAHTCGHAAQIVALAKLLAGPSWKTLSIPRGKSREFNAAHGGEGEAREAKRGS